VTRRDSVRVNRSRGASAAAVFGIHDEFAAAGKCLGASTHPAIGGLTMLSTIVGVRSSLRLVRHGRPARRLPEAVRVVPAARARMTRSPQAILLCNATRTCAVVRS
jgi:hypothetical protein